MTTSADDHYVPGDMIIARMPPHRGGDELGLVIAAIPDDRVVRAGCMQYTVLWENHGLVQHADGLLLGIYTDRAE